MNFNFNTMEGIPLFRKKTIRKRAFLIISSSFLLFFFSSCKKDEKPVALPPLTSIGANTFGAIVNGKVLNISGAGNFSGGMYADPDEDSCGNCWHPPDSSDLYLRIKKDGINAIYIFLTDPRVSKEWRLNRPTSSFWELGDRPLRAYIQIDGFSTGLTTDGWIRSDLYSRGDGIFSAQFDFHCTNPKTCQEFSLTDGRIDVNLNSISYFP